MSFLPTISVSAYPYILGLLLIVGIGLIIAVVYLTSSALKAAGKKKTEPAEPPPQKIKIIPDDKLPPIGGRLIALLSTRGWFKISALALSFIRAMEFLRNHLDSIHYKYRLPWYLLIGTSYSGKTSLLNGADFVLPVGQPDFTSGEPHPGCTWWLLNRGIVLDIRGDYLIKERGTDAEEKGWRGLTALLARYRAQRPIDGIILTIPADEIYGPWKLSREEMSDRAHFLSVKLKSLQERLGVRIPVYIVITKSDFFPGFTSLCQAIPQNHRHDMLGWSNPHTLTTAYQPHLLDEAFDIIYRSLIHLRLEIFTQGASENVDALYILASEISSVKSDLATYINTIFKESTYEDSLIFRGLYLCGDGGSQLDTHFLERFNNPEELDITDFNTPPPQGRQIFFANHIFNERIFREKGLVEPIHRRLITAHRGLNWAKAAVAGFVTLGTIGMIRSYERFTHQQDFLIPTLNKITNNIRELKVIRATDPNSNFEKFETYAREMIDFMQKVHHTKFFSILTPASWFSSMDSHMQRALKEAYEEIIIDTIHLSLIHRGKELLNPTHKPKETTANLGELLQPMIMPEAKKLKAFAAEFMELVRYTERYNQMAKTHNAHDLDSLVQYVFGVPLPPEFKEQYSEFDHTFRNSAYTPIDIKASLPLAQDRLLYLYRRFIDALMGSQNATSLLGRINEIVLLFGQQSARKTPDANILRKFVKESSPAILNIGKSGHTWMDLDYFNPSKEFEDLMNQLANSNVFGPVVVQTMADETGPIFLNFSNQLKSFNQLLFKLSKDPGSEIPPPSKAVFDLTKHLETLMDEPFMEASEPFELKKTVPSGKILYWDTKMVDKAMDMVKAYDEFTQKKIEAYPAILQGTLKLVAAKNLQQSVINTVARSQTFIDAPQADSQGLIAEEVLKNKIKFTKGITEKFIKILNALDKNGAGSTFIALRSMLADSHIQLLGFVESLLQSITPFAVRENNFDWWDGKTPAAYAGYGVKDDIDLKAHIKLHADQMKVLALDYALPVVNFLGSKAMSEAEIDQTLLNRWRRIVDQMQLYAKKKPDSSLRGLEEFIIKDLNTITSKNCFEKIPLTDVRGDSGDYFLDIRQKLKRSLLSRAEVLRRREAVMYYINLVDFFNGHLKGKFPFVSTSADTETPEVDPSDLREFYEIYNLAGGSPQKILDQIYQLGPEAKPMVDFLNNMEQIRGLLKTFLDDPQSNEPFLDFSVDFRVNKTNEKGGNYVIEWYVKPDDTKKISNFDKDKSGRWSFDNPVEIGFRWPDGIDTKPFRDKGQPFMSIDETTAVFSYPGRWSLLWLLAKQRASKKDLAGSAETKPNVLKYEIPTGPQSKSTIFIRVTLQEPPKGKTPGKMIKLPNFPLEAPVLPREIIALQDKPVLATGEREANPFKEPSDKDEDKAEEAPAEEEEAPEEKPEKEEKEEKTGKEEKDEPPSETETE